MQRLFDRRVADCERALGVRLPVTYDTGPYPHFKTKRGFGVTFQDCPGGPCHIRLAKKLTKAPRHRQDGIIRHELGHVLDLTLPARELNAWCRKRGVRLPAKKHGEIRADAIAHAVWGKPLKYDKDTVQSTTQGTWPRPAHLGT